MEFKPFKMGKYLLLERIATGGMAEVYRATASGAGGFSKQLAIKRIIPSYSQNEEFRRMFEHEARLTSQLNHANIVQIFDFVKMSDTYLLAMEFVDGKNLRQIINKSKKLQLQLPIDFSTFIINEVTKGLDYAHQKRDDISGKPLNIIHRDMSPQNIMISYDGAVKIVDFGIAKARGRVDETRSGVIKGKFGYMSPEQAAGEEVDVRSDLFSTAIILYELITHQRLFTSDNDMATLKKIQECIVKKPRLLNPKINDELERIVLQALTKERALRYQTAGLFHRKLQEYVNKYHSTFSQKDVSHWIQKLFAEEIAIEKKRIEEILRQSIPYSQGSSEKNSESTHAKTTDSTEPEILPSEPTFVGEPTEDHSLFEEQPIKNFTPLKSLDKKELRSTPPATKKDVEEIELPTLGEAVTVSKMTEQKPEKSYSGPFTLAELSYPNEVSTTEKQSVSTERYSLKKNKSSKKSLIFGMGIVFLIFSYFVLNSSQPTPSPEIAKENISKNSKERTVTHLHPSSTGPLCSITIDSTPNKAKIKIDGIERGLTPNALSVSCNKTSEIALELDGFQSLRKQIVAKKDGERFSLTLTKIAQGRLEITPSQNVKIFIEDKYYGEANAFERFSLNLPANRRYKVRFENTLFKIKTTKSYLIEADSIQRDAIHFDIPQK